MDLCSVPVSRVAYLDTVASRKGAIPIPRPPLGFAEKRVKGVELLLDSRLTSWTPDLVNQVAKAQRPVRVTGQLMFDSSHTPCISGKAVKDDPARVSLWEVHPIYKFEVCGQGNCTSNTGWVPLEEWKQ